MGFALPSPSSGTSRFFGFDRVCLIPNLLSLLNDNFTTLLIVNLPSSDEFQFLSFVSQSGGTSPHILDSRESNYCGDVLWNQKKELKEEEATAIACAEDVTLAEVQTVASLVLV